MAVLFANTRQMDLSEALGSVGELKGVIANELRQAGFTDVVNTQAEVAGNRSGGVRLSVLHLPIVGRSFWQIVMAGGDTADITQGAVNEVVNRIQHLHPLQTSIHRVNSVDRFPGLGRGKLTLLLARSCVSCRSLVLRLVRVP